MSPWFLHALFWLLLYCVIHRIACWTTCRYTFDDKIPALRQWAYTLSSLAAVVGGIALIWWLVETVLRIQAIFGYVMVSAVTLYLGVQLTCAIWILQLPRGRYLKFLLISFVAHFGLMFIYGALFDNMVQSYLFLP